MSAKVHAESPAFKKPIANADPPLKAYDPAYLERKAQVGEKIFKLKSGRQLAYFTEGNPEDPAVLCLHGLSQNKYAWLQPQPIPGVYLIAVDRQGHGSSSPYDGYTPFAPFLYSDCVGEFMELLDELKVDKFYVTGHSMGASTTVNVAAAQPERVLGCAPIAAMCDVWHPTVAPKDRAREESLPGLYRIRKKGCMGALARKLMYAFTPYHADKTKDFGFAAIIDNEVVGAGCSPETKAACFKDPFLITKMCDVTLHGGNCVNFGPVEQSRQWGGPHCYDAANIKCPTFIYQGEKEVIVTAFHAKQLHKIIPGAELIVMTGHGHGTLSFEYARIVSALAQGKAAEGTFGNTSLK